MNISIRTSIIILAAMALISCSEVKPSERAATIRNVDYLMCGACGGQFVQVDSVTYRADIPAPYNKENTPVWIRYEKDERDDLKVLGRWIIIKSIRNREK